VRIAYNGESNSSLEFEMLEGLKKGQNYTWSFTWQRKINKNMQLNLNYSGRKSPGNPVINVGSMQVRAFF